MTGSRTCKNNHKCGCGSDSEDSDSKKCKKESPKKCKKESPKKCKKESPKKCKKEEKKKDSDSDSDEKPKKKKECKKEEPVIVKVPEIKRVFEKYRYVTAFPPAYDFPTEYKCYRVEDFVGKHGKLELVNEECPIETSGENPDIKVTQQCRALS